MDRALLPLSTATTRHSTKSGNDPIAALLGPGIRTLLWPPGALRVIGDWYAFDKPLCSGTHRTVMLSMPGYIGPIGYSDPLSDGKDTLEKCRDFLSWVDDHELSSLHGHSFDKGALSFGFGFHLCQILGCFATCGTIVVA